MKFTNLSAAIASSLLIFVGVASPVAANTAAPSPTPSVPPAPGLIAPANGASVVQPIALDWNSVSATGGPIGSYTWQVAKTSGFTTIVASGFTDMDSDPSVPTPTNDKLSGLPNGTYFWRVKATQLTGGATGSVDSPWSAVQSFNVTGLGPAPATPSFVTPANNSSFHIRESYQIQWTAVPNAQYYILEAANEPTFSYPLALTQAPLNFGTVWGEIWGNALTAYYRIRAVSSNGVRGLPSATLKVTITDSAPVPAAVSPVAPADGASVQLPFFLDWSDTPNPQVPGYEVDINTSSSFALSSSALNITPTRSDYMITRDLLAPGTYFWHVRAWHGDVAGPWSAARTITVTAPVTPPNVNLFAILAEPVNAYGGNSAHARVMLDNPAPAGGAIVTVSTDLPQVNLPATTVTVPGGQTDATITNIATGPVPNNGTSVGIIGDLFAGFANGRGQNSFGILPILYGLSLSDQSVVGGTSVTGTVTLQSAAPPGGTTVRLVSSDTSLVNPPATVFIPQGGTAIDFAIPTSAVSVSRRVTIDTGTDVDGYRAPQISLVLTPTGSPLPAATLSSLTLSQSSVLSGGTITGTVRLTSPAPSGGTLVSLSASMEGQVIAPPSVTVPAGSVSADFTTTPAPETPFARWVMVQARDANSGAAQARVLEIDPAPGAPTLLAIGPAGQNVIGGNPARATVALVIPAPAGGGVVNLSTDNPSVLQVPASVTIPQGNSALSFNIGTTPVSTSSSGGNVIATAGGVTKSIFVTVNPDPNAPPILASLALNPSTTTGGNSITGTVLLNSPAPSGGTQATLSTSNLVAKPPAVVTVPAGQTSVNFTVTTSAVTSNTPVTITATVGSASQSAGLTLTPAAAPAPTPVPTATPASTTLTAPSQISPAADSRFLPGTNITFDWSDVSGAASYTIQISNQDTFPTSIVNQNVTVSQFSTSTLPTTTMWWRVRANDASGNPGAWSAARRFEVKS